MQFTRASAQVLHQRLLMGLSWIDTDGHERIVSPERARPPRGTVPSADELLARYGGTQPEVDADEIAAHIARKIAALAGGPVPVVDPVDVAALAAKAGLSLDEIRAMPDEPRSVPVLETRARMALYASRTPDRFVAVVAGTLRDTQPLKDVREWIACGKWGIALSGDPGTGKTVAAVAGMAERGGGMFVTAEEIAAPSGRELVELAEAAPYLVIDDTGDEALTDLGIVRFRQLLGARHTTRRQTVITSNMEIAAWAERYGARLVDRLREGAGFRQYKGASMRRAG